MNDSPLMHLTEDQIDEFLVGDGAPELEAHLAGCALCRAQVEPFQATVAAFNQSTMEWARAKSNTISRDLSGARPSRHPLRAWSLGAAFLAAVALIFASGITRQTPSTPQTQTTQMAEAPQTPAEPAADSAQEIAADNAMLHAIDSATNTVEPSPLRPFRSTRLSSSHHTAPREVQD